MKNPALLVIDMIYDGFIGWDPVSRSDLTNNINQICDVFRRKNLRIIWVRQEFEPDLSDAFQEMREKEIKRYIKGTKGADILEELKVLPEEDVVVKKRYSSFFRTDLDKILNKYDVNTLVLAGINTHACIRTTAIDAYQRDYEVILAIDCVRSHNNAWHESSLDYMENKIAIYLHNEELINMLE